MEYEFFDIVYLVGFLLATLIRTYYGLQFRRKQVFWAQREHPAVFLGMIIWGIALLLPLIAMSTDWLKFAAYDSAIGLRVLGVPVFIGSVWLLWLSHRDLGRNFSPSLLIRKEHQLVTTGVYEKIRHPMYLSFFLWAIGQALIIANWLAGPLGLLGFGLIYIFRVQREEQQLLELFGDTYREYLRNTGRLLPRWEQGNK